MCFYEVHRGVLKKALLSFKINKVIFQEGTSMFKNKVNFLKKDVVGVCVIVSFTYKVYRLGCDSMFIKSRCIGRYVIWVDSKSSSRGY